MGFLRVEVRDSGVGLSSEEQKKIFGEYSQFDIKELQGGGNQPIGKHSVQRWSTSVEKPRTIH